MGQKLTDIDLTTVRSLFIDMVTNSETALKRTLRQLHPCSISFHCAAAGQKAQETLSTCQSTPIEALHALKEAVGEREFDKMNITVTGSLLNRHAKAFEKDLVDPEVLKERKRDLQSKLGLHKEALMPDGAFRFKGKDFTLS